MVMTKQIGHGWSQEEDAGKNSCEDSDQKITMNLLPEIGKAKFQ
jgi:hypothetical protein